MAKNSTQEQLDQISSVGGHGYLDGVRIFVDNPINYEVSGAPTGFWITSAMGFKVYFKCNARTEAQHACNTMFGKGRYTVNSKV